MNQDNQHTAASSELPQENEVSLLDLIQTVAENLRLLIVTPLAIGLIALGISFAIPPTFTAKVQFLPPQQQQSMASSMIASLGALGNLAGAAGGLRNPADQYIAFLKSASIQDTLISRFNLVTRYELDLKEDTRKKLATNIRASSGKDGLIALEADDEDPKFAAELANAHVEELQKLLSRLAVTEAQQRRMFFEKQLLQTKDNLAKAESALRAVGVDANALKSNPQAALEGVARLRAVITAQEVKVGSMRGYLAESAPDFKQAMLELSALRAQLGKLEKNEPVSAKSEGNVPGKADFVSRYRDFKYQETLYDLFARQFEIAKVDESREGAVIQVLDAAQAPERKTGPKKGLIAIIATLITGFLLLLLVFTRKMLTNATQDRVTSEKINSIKQALRKAFGRN